MSLALSVLTPDSPGFESAVTQVARLRIAVFRAWPYLYDGTMDYEQNYISKLASAEGALIVVARDDAQEDAPIVGVSTGMPLASEHDELIRPFRAQGYDPAEIFYGAETVMLPDYRGRGLYREFLERRRGHAQTLGGFRYECFCGVRRPDDHPLRDPSVLSLEPVWERYGFRKLEGLVTGFSWKDVGESEESEKQMQFWMRDL